MAKQPDLPFVSMLTDDEITQAICNHAMKKQLGLDPDAHSVTFKVTYRNIKQPEGGYRLFASIAITDIVPTDPAAGRDSKADDA